MALWSSTELQNFSVECMRWHVNPKHNNATLSFGYWTPRVGAVRSNEAGISVFTLTIDRLLLDVHCAGTYRLLCIAVVDIVFDKAMVHGDVVAAGRQLFASNLVQCSLYYIGQFQHLLFVASERCKFLRVSKTKNKQIQRNYCPRAISPIPVDGSNILLVIIFLSPNTIRNGTCVAIAVFQLHFHLFLLALFDWGLQFGQPIAQPIDR